MAVDRMVSEPALVTPRQAESELQSALLLAIKAVLDRRVASYALVEGFGLDIAAFIRVGETAVTKFLELKAFAGSRQGGIGFGNGKGEGVQVAMLWDNERNQAKTAEQLAIFQSSTRWVLADATQAYGTARFALFDCVKASASAMGGVHPGKQNNLRLSSLRDDWVTWMDLIGRVEEFLLR